MEKIVDKIKKLMAKAQSSTDLGNIEEANTFAAKATELMVKHAIDNELLKDKPILTIGQLFIPDSEIHKKREGQWIYSLYNTIATFNFGSILLHKGRGITIIANEEYLPIINSIADSLAFRLRAVCKAETALMRKVRGPNFNPNAFARAFLQGAVDGIFSQLRAKRQEANQEYSNLPVIVNTHKTALKAYIDEKWGKLKANKAANYSSIEGTNRGYDIGKNMSVHSGVNITGGKQNLLN